MHKKILFSALLIVTAASFSACKSKVDEAPKAKVEQQQPAAAPSEEKPAPTDTKPEEKKDEDKEAGETRDVPVNTKKSTIKFIGAKITGDHHGGFTKWTGTATISGKDKLDKIKFSIDMKTVYTENDTLPVDDVEKVRQNDPDQKPIEPGRLSKHLMDEDFFNVDKFPTSTFESSKIVPDPGKPDMYNITGNLTMHGVTQTITFPAKIELDGDGDELEASADFTINRFDFGIKYPGKKDDLIKKDVRLMINLDFPIEDEDEEHEHDGDAH